MALFEAWLDGATVLGKTGMWCPIPWGIIKAPTWDKDFTYKLKSVKSDLFDA